MDDSTLLAMPRVIEGQPPGVFPGPVVEDSRAMARKLKALDRDCYVLKHEAGLGFSHTPPGSGTQLLAVLSKMMPEQFGAASFRRDHGLKYAYMSGAMAKGIAGEELVIALGKKGFLGCFGAGALPLPRVEDAIIRIQAALPDRPYAFNFLHSPRKLAKEDATADLYLKHGVRTVEASSYISLTPSIVRYRLAGLAERADGSVAISNRVIVKVSRVEVAGLFMQPPDRSIVNQLLEQRRISPLQARLAERVPMADDITVEADSGGHTDNRPLVVLLPAMLKLRDTVQRKHCYPTAVRIGAAGGISTPRAILAAFMLGADYVVTGSVNQSCVEAQTSAAVKTLLAKVGVADVAMAPESDMFEHGYRVQALKQGSLYPMRAQKLFETYQKYDGIHAIPPQEKAALERQIFKDTLENVWEQTVQFLAGRQQHEEIARAESPKVKMALTFKWYLGQSSIWAVQGVPDRQLDYQVWCGPAMGAFNDWARGTYLESLENRRVADVARVLMYEAAYAFRLQQLNLLGLSDLAATLPSVRIPS